MDRGTALERLEKCFKDFATGDVNKLNKLFMTRTLDLYKENVENNQEDSLQKLTSFLQCCEKGNWNDAKSLCSAAIKEYEKYVKTKAQESTAETREVSDGQHSNTGVEETQLVRRSKDASIRLMHDNPNISDLSDPNRPIKLAERFSELYSNEYTDAFEELNNQTRPPAEHIKYLLDRVKSPDDQVRIYDTMMKLREDAERTLLIVREDFMKLRRNKMRERTQKFAIQCVEIVWLMSIQQPPLHLEWIDSKRVKFNPDLYRAYTKSGDFIEFCVWPVLRLHEEGPILARGIAQGCN